MSSIGLKTYNNKDSLSLEFMPSLLNITKQLSILIAVWVAASSYSIDHPLKMTFSKLNISAEGQIELETRIFLDDLTEHMQNLYQIQHADFTNISTEGAHVLQKYINSQLYFEQKNKRINLTIHNVSLSKNKLALVVNMSTTASIDITDDIQLTNTILCDATPLQTNDIKHNDQHYILSINNPNIKFSPF